MSKVSFFAGMFGLPLLALLMLIGWLTPRYVPSNSLASAAASTSLPEVARERMIASFVGRLCRRNWNLDQFQRTGEATLYSWESDAGLIAQTRMSCLPGRRCSVTAKALIRWPFPPQLGGKPIPTRIWGCGISTPDWTQPNRPR